MRNLKLTDITTSIGMPLKAGSLEHIQLAYKEAIEYLTKSNIGAYYDNTKMYIIHGCVNSGSGANYVISAGAIFYQGEIYLVDAATFSTTGGNVPVCTITTTYYTGTEADQVIFTDSVGRNVHEIKKIVIASGASGSGTANYSAVIFLNATAVSKTITAGSFSNGQGSASYTGGTIAYTKQNGIVTMNVSMTITPSTYNSGFLLFYLDLATYIPFPVALSNFSYGFAPCGQAPFLYGLRTSPTQYKNAMGFLQLQSGVNTPVLQINLFDTTTSMIDIYGQITFLTNT